jgi:cobalt-zinc-cadmium efflux system outer membrane protein
MLEIEPRSIRRTPFGTAAATAIAVVLVSLASRAASPASNEDADDYALTLDSANRLMVERNRDIRIARYAVDAARSAVSTAAARPNPNLSLGASNINPQAGIGPGSLKDKAFDTQIRLDYLVERGGKREKRMAGAEQLEQASRLDMADTMRTQRLQAGNAYYDLALAQTRLRLMQETASLFATTLDASRRRLAAGDVAASDVDRIVVDALRAESDARGAVADRDRARVALATLLGLEGISRRLSTVDAWPPLDAEAGAIEHDEDVVEARPDVRAARARLAAASEARELARALRSRDVTIAVTYDHWPQNGDNTQGTGNSYGVSMSVPLFVGNRFDGEIARAESDFGIALVTLDKTVGAARADLARTRDDLASTRARAARYDDALLDAARRVARAQDFAYERGAIGVLDLLDARRTLRAVELDAAGARADYAKALLAWRQARVVEEQG